MMMTDRMMRGLSGERVNHMFAPDPHLETPDHPDPYWEAPNITRADCALLRSRVEEALDLTPRGEARSALEGVLDTLNDWVHA